MYYPNDPKEVSIRPLKTRLNVEQVDWEGKFGIDQNIFRRTNRLTL